MAGLTDDGVVAVASAQAENAQLRPTAVVDRIRRWGFLVRPDLPDGPGPAFLLVALRPTPTVQHYDPEAVDYWVTDGHRGRRRTLSRASAMPRSEPFSWGTIRLVDRLGIENDYLTFGGRLDAAAIDDVIVAVFTSTAPLLRRGGHSQGWDAGADAVGAFFARLLVAVDFEPGFEAALGSTEPLTRYAAFVRDLTDRRRQGPPDLRAQDELGRLADVERRRLTRLAPDAWRAGEELLTMMSKKPKGETIGR